MRSLLPLLLLVRLLPAQGLDQIANDELARQHIPGLVLVAVKEDRVIYAKGFGATSVETGAPVTGDTLFRLGSTTKMFVSGATLKLAEQGRLHMDSPVGDYISGLNPTVAKLTPHQLLSHTAGLMDETKMYGSHDDDALAKNVASWKDDVFFTQPGRVYSYSNLGFVLAGRLIEAVKGKPFADAMEELIFQPLGMKRSTFRPTMAMTYPLATGHTAEGAVVRPAADHAGYWPAGSLFTSGNDFAKFVIAFLNTKQFAALAKPNVEQPGLGPAHHYGYGLEIDSTRGVQIVQHGGSRTGYRSHVMMAPEFKAGVIVLCNKDGAQPAPIAQKALESLLAVRFGVTPSPSAPGNAEIGKYTGRYVNGPNSVEIAASEGKLTAKLANSTHALDPVSANCFKGGQTTVCFTDGFAHVGGRAYSKQP
jgi:CubicO group peptidase (beta-lactamase class C family)